MQTREKAESTAGKVEWVLAWPIFLVALMPIAPVQAGDAADISTQVRLTYVPKQRE